MKQRTYGKNASKYLESEPDLTNTGVGKNYDGFRIFHSRKRGDMEYIGRDYSLRPPNEAELKQFRKDLATAALNNPKIARYLEEFPALCHRPAPEPAVEGIMTEREPLTSSASSLPGRV
jgi:hypothetical protein